jgi:hypothetical protein
LGPLSVSVHSSRGREKEREREIETERQRKRERMREIGSERERDRVRERGRESDLFSRGLSLGWQQQQQHDAVAVDWKCAAQIWRRLSPQTTKVMAAISQSPNVLFGLFRGKIHTK